MPELPLVSLALPEMRRTKAVGQAREVIPVHDRAFKHLVCDREFLGGDTQIAKNFISESLGEFTVVTLDQRHAFIAIDVA